MTERTLLLLLLLTIPTQSTSKQLHRLVGGHMRLTSPPQLSDAELLTAAATGSRDSKKPDEDETRKTLSQQVADGKYGLIQKELFTKPPKRPGVLSYHDNPEVPKDNINNLGGLSKNEIWLAENHLLVLRGGTYPPHDDNKNDNEPSVWPAIDDYKAPNRQVKIPAHPKIPPPFPVQLSDDGPLQILGTNSSRTLNGSLETNTYALPPPEGYEPGTGPFFPPAPPYYSDPSNATAGENPLGTFAKTSGEYQPGSPLPHNNFPLNGSLPPFFASLPPGAAILPPPSNQTDLYDEDDPSIYYPPPYSFFYPKDNTSKVPAGPLVPGIILPPPPNFFAPLEEGTTSTTTNKPAIVRHRTTTYATTKTPIKIYPVHVPQEINNELTEKAKLKVVTVLPVVRNRERKKPPPQSVTILRPVKVKPAPPSSGQYVPLGNKLQRPLSTTSNKPFRIYGPPNTVISTTQVPLKLYYSTTSNEIESNSVTQVPNEKIQKPAQHGTKPTAKYYYYEEQHGGNGKNRGETTTKNQYYEFVAKQTPKPQYIYVTARPYNTQRPKYRFVQQPKPKPENDNFSIHIARLEKQIHQYYTTPRPRQPSPPKPVYQYSFQAANYQNQHEFKASPEMHRENQDGFRPMPKYSVQIQQAVEIIPPTEPPSIRRPVYYEKQPPRNRYIATPRPITQYSFQATANPVYQEYYTKPDEGYYDDITKKYFTMFGQKIANSDHTTPLPPPQVQQVEQTTVRPAPVYNHYAHMQPQINPNAQLVEINHNGQNVNYPQVSARGAPYQHDDKRGSENQSGSSYISYELPGDNGAHFYFLTPQLAQRRDQGAGYFYSQPNTQSRIK